MLARVIIRREIDRVFVEIVEQRIGDFRQPRFGIAHRGGLIGIHRSEIALAINQHDAHRPILRQAGKGTVNRAVSMRVIFAHDVADDAAALAIGFACDIAGLVTSIENAAMHGFQTIDRKSVV